MSDAPPPPGHPAAPEPPAAPAGGGKTNGLAIASLVLGILSCIPGANIAAVVCGHMALGRIKQSGEGGKPLAIIGLVLGYVSILAWIILLLTGGLAFLVGTSASEEMFQEMERMERSMPQDMPMPEPR
jgi:hypothetical protein